MADGEGEERGPLGPRRGARGPAKDPAKRDAIVRAARALFQRVGYEAASMDAIAEAAGVSKRTVYNHFGDKDALFQATVAAAGAEVVPALRGRAVDVEDLRRRLVEFGVAVTELVSTPEAVAFGRMLLFHVERDAGLIARFYESGPARGHRDLADLLRRAHDDGQLAVLDPDLAADQLQSMWLGRHHFRQQLGLAPPRTRRQIADHVRSCVEMFLRAYAPGSTSPGRAP